MKVNKMKERKCERRKETWREGDHAAMGERIGITTFSAYITVAHVPMAKLSLPAYSALSVFSLPVCFWEGCWLPARHLTLMFALNSALSSFLPSYGNSMGCLIQPGMCSSQHMPCWEVSASSSSLFSTLTSALCLYIACVLCGS